MGEARRRREARAAFEAAWRLGGAEALKVMVAPGETFECPVCDWNGLVPVSDNYPAGARTVCPLCDGKGGLRRSGPREDEATRPGGKPRFLDLLSTAPRPRTRY
jgi:hypothetical protein